MLHSFWTLLRLQLSEKLKWKTNASTGFKVATIAKRIAYIGVAFGIFTALFYVIFNVLFLEPNVEYFVFFIFILQAISIISCVVQASNVLYTSKDNALLLTYPVKHHLVYISKISVMYILELLKSLTLVFPLFMAYGTVVPGVFSVNYVLSGFIYSIILPFIPVLLGAIISIPFVYLTKILKHSNWVKGLFSLILFAGLIVLTVFFVKFIQDNSPIRIVALFKKFNRDIAAFVTKFNRFSLYANFIGRGMYAKNAADIWTNHGLMLAVLVGIALVSIAISLPCFFRLASSASENAATKDHKGENKAHNSTFITFFRKEMTLSIRNIGNFASDYAFLFAMPFIVIILTCIFVHIDRNALGMSLTYGLLGLVILVMLCASNTASATAISSEGSEFVLLKTAPGKTSNIIWSKLLVNFIIAFIMTTVSFIILRVVLAADIQKGLLDSSKLFIVYVYVNLIEIGLLLWSIQLDIVNPKLREFANAQNKNEITNSSTSIVIGLIFSIVFSAILLILFITTLPLYIIAILLIGVGLVFVGLRFYFLIRYRDAFFEDIQLWTRKILYLF